jgi:RNA polymerase sigma-70 factor (ECF subfamily)
METTADLLTRLRHGDAAARERLLNRYLPVLRRWAHGRLPQYARGLVDTDDLVQVTLLRVVNHLNEFEPRHEGAFLAYLRRALINSVRDEIRRTMRQGGRETISESLPDELPSAVEQAIGKEAMEAYEAALALLPEVQQQAVILRVEFGYSYPEIAAALDRPSANAVRMMVARALVQLAEVMHERA